MADFTTLATFLTSGENSHSPVLKETVKVQLLQDMLGKITFFTHGEQAIVNLCCKLHTRWQLLVFPTSETNSYYSLVKLHSIGDITKVCL